MNGSGPAIAYIPAGTSSPVGFPVQGITGGVPFAVSDPANAPYSLWPVISAPTGTYTAASGTRAIAVNTTTAGVVTFTDASGNTMPWNIAVGSSVLPFVPVSFTLTSGVATFYGLK